MGFGNFSLSQPRKIPRKSIPRFQIGIVASQWLPEGIKTGNLLPNKAKTRENSPNCPWGSTFLIPMQGSHNSWKILGSTFPIQIQGSHNSWDGSVPVGSQISQKKQTLGSREAGSLWKLPWEFQPWIQGSATAGGWKNPWIWESLWDFFPVFLSSNGTEGFP